MMMQGWTLNLIRGLKSIKLTQTILEFFLCLLLTHSTYVAYAEKERGDFTASFDAQAECTQVVATAEDLQYWAEYAQPGDVICVAKGTYIDWGVIEITTKGTESRPITYKAEESGQVVFKGDVIFKIKNAEWVILADFDFQEVGQGSPPRSVIQIVYAENCRITNCRFFSCGSSPTNGVTGISIEIGTKALRIDHCLFDDSRYGMIWADVRENTDYPRDIHVDHNTFQNSTAYGAVGTASGRPKNTCLEETNFLVEYNVFKNIVEGNGNPQEIIVNKSSSNVYRYNTFQDLPLGKLSLRCGNDCTVLGNTFIDSSGGITITGKRHIIVNNVMVDTKRAFKFTYGSIENLEDWFEGDGGYVAAQDCIIAYNTAIASSQSTMHVNNSAFEPATILPSNNWIVNNIFVADHDKFFHPDVQDGSSIIDNNIFYSLDHQTPTGILGTNTILDAPLFSGTGLDARLSLGSPAIDRAVAIPNFELTTDIAGNSRPQGLASDLGAYEYVPSLSGDVNGDGYVNSLDVQACVDHILGLQDWGQAADVNGDGAVNVLDVQEIVNILSGGT
jgi:poly(beta-D-mannuronate) lyase